VHLKAWESEESKLVKEVEDLKDQLLTLKLQYDNQSHKLRMTEASINSYVNNITLLETKSKEKDERILEWVRDNGDGAGEIPVTLVGLPGSTDEQGSGRAKQYTAARICVFVVVLGIIPMYYFISYLCMMSYHTYVLFRIIPMYCFISYLCIVSYHTYVLFHIIPMYCFISYLCIVSYHTYVLF